MQRMKVEDIGVLVPRAKYGRRAVDADVQLIRLLEVRRNRKRHDAELVFRNLIDLARAERGRAVYARLELVGRNRSRQIGDGGRIEVRGVGPARLYDV
jgi:hypothetical protein